MRALRVAALVGSSLIGLSAPGLAQTEASQPADVTGGSQDVVPGGEPEAAIEQNDAGATSSRRGGATKAFRTCRW